MNFLCILQGSGRAGYATREEYAAAELAFLSGGSGNSSSDTGGAFESTGSTSQLDFRREMLRQGMSTEEYVLEMREGLV